MSSGTEPLPLRFESLGQYHDAWSTVLLFAPDAFRTLEGAPAPDQPAALDAAFAQLRAGFVHVERKLKAPRLLGVLRAMLDLSHEAYRAGDGRRGAHILRECEGMIWPSRRCPVKYAVEAEQRAFGSLQLYRDVEVSPYPKVGSLADLGPRQQALLQFAQAQVQPHVEARAAFKWRGWAMAADGTVSPVKAPSRKALLERLREGAARGSTVACVTASFPFGVDLLAFVLEEAGRPRVEAITIVRDGAAEPFNVHLHEPDVFAPRP